MNYFYQRLSYLFLSSFFLFFSSVSAVDAAIIIRPPNNLGLVGYWSFDEGRGTQVSDMSGNGNSGTLVSNPQWVSGRSGAGISFDGSIQHVEIPDSASFDIGASGFTYAAWIKPSSFTQPYNMFMGQVLPYFNVRNTRVLHMSMYASGSQRSVLGGTELEEDRWYHAVATYDSDGYMKVFLNGVEDGTAGPYLTPGNQTSNVYIGKWRSNTTYPFTGEVDEVRVYNRALSEAEVLLLYSNTKSTVVGEVPPNHYSDGLVSHWTFDGSTISGTSVGDTVGANDATMSGNVSPTLGIIGQGLAFDGNQDYVRTTTVSDITTTYTVSGWIKPRTLSAHHGDHSSYGFTIFSEDSSSYVLWLTVRTSGELELRTFQSGTSGQITNGANIEIDEWAHVAVTSTKGGTSKAYVNGEEVLSFQNSGIHTWGGNFYIGELRANRNIVFDGAIDDVRVYNRILSLEEIQGLALGGFGALNSSTNDLLRDGLVGLWTFDNGTVSGNAVQDLSGNENTGTVIGNPLSVPGKIREAFEFDTNGDAINTAIRPNTIDDEAVSFFAWVRVASGAEGQRMKIFSGYSGGVNRWDFEYGHSGNKLSFNEWGGSGAHAGSTDMLESVWYHVGFVWSSSGEVVLYINGVEDSIFSLSNSTLDDGVNFYIGGRPNLSELEWGGLIDNVRLYERALTPHEVGQLYFMGS